MEVKKEVTMWSLVVSLRLHYVYSNILMTLKVPMSFSRSQKSEYRSQNAEWKLKAEVTIEVKEEVKEEVK